MGIPVPKVRSETTSGVQHRAAEHAEEAERLLASLLGLINDSSRLGRTQRSPCSTSSTLRLTSTGV